MSEPIWAVVELMGHVKLAGRLTEEERFGSKIGRLEIPQVDGSFVTRWFGGSAVYGITAVSEEVARIVAAKSSDVAPVSIWDFPQRPAALPASSQEWDEGSVGTDEGVPFE